MDGGHPPPIPVPFAHPLQAVLSMRHKLLVKTKHNGVIFKTLLLFICLLVYLLVGGSVVNNLMIQFVDCDDDIYLVMGIMVVVDADVIVVILLSLLLLLLSLLVLLLSVTIIFIVSIIP